MAAVRVALVQGVLGLETQLGSSECHTCAIIRNDRWGLFRVSYQIVATSLLAGSLGNVDDLLALRKGELVLVRFDKLPLRHKSMVSNAQTHTIIPTPRVQLTFIALPGVNWPKMLVSFKIVMYSLSEVSEPGMATAVPK